MYLYVCGDAVVVLDGSVGASRINASFMCSEQSDFGYADVEAILVGHGGAVLC